jgi:hypothetical protein
MNDTPTSSQPYITKTGSPAKWESWAKTKIYLQFRAFGCFSLLGISSRGSKERTRMQDLPINCTLSIQRAGMEGFTKAVWEHSTEPLIYIPICMSGTQLSNPSFLRRPPKILFFHFPPPFIHFQIILVVVRTLTLARDPLPRVKSDEVVERPRFLRQFLRVRRPDVRFAFYPGVQCLRRILREGLRCGGCQVWFLSPGGTGDAMFRNFVSCEWDDGPQGMDLNLPPGILLIHKHDQRTEGV